jgi:4-methylaminobutanoate oxidase (formaldehyde-forming)
MSSQAAWIDEAEVVVLGGGVIGSSIAYHLCLAGMTNVLVLERNELSSGATARAAGLVCHARSDANITRMVSRTRAAMSELETLLGEPIGFRQVGAIRAAHTACGEQDMRVMESCLETEGIPAERIDAAAARQFCPWLELGDATRIIFVSSDGYVDGARLGMAYARAARLLGTRIRRGVEATGLVQETNKVCGVLTDQGPIRASHVVDAAGAWGPQISRWIGWGFPAAPTRSHYWITAPDGNGLAERPNVHLPDLRAYLRSEVGGLVVGLQEPHSRTYDPFKLAPDMGSLLLHDENGDLDLLVEQAAALRAVVPGIDDWRFAHHITGLSMYTPDGKFLIGAPDGIEGFVVAGGCCGSGVAASGGFGKTVADLVTGRQPDIDLDPFRPSRFGPTDPKSQEFRDRCSAARSGKSRGKPDPVYAGVT